ncbi:MAG: hypothetical protein JNM31_14365 [Flavobacteriales bacterium]|nr:hypothetical protein [Flavobacteriales bacterium]
MTQRTSSPTRAAMFYSILALGLVLLATAAHAQLRTTVGILRIESRNIMATETMLTTVVRIELEKTGRADVISPEVMNDALDKAGIARAQCTSITCLQQAGQVLKADYMLLGSVERFGERIIIILKLMNVTSGEIQKVHTGEYLNLEDELQRMIEISVKQLMGVEPDPNLVKMLEAYGQPVKSPITKVNLSGPRFGVFHTGGLAGERMRADRVPYGGLGMYGVSSMIGWQQEVQYLGSGDFQCLFEFLVTGSGLESGRFIPAISILNGFRLNNSGWELAFGPIFRFVRMADGYYLSDEYGNFDAVKDWRLKGEWNSANGPNPYPIVRNIDDRGDPTLTAGLIIAVGKTFRSGQLNIPVNAYIIPRKDGTVLGLAMGFNVFKSSKR